MGWGWAGAGLQAGMGRAASFRALRPRPSGLWGRSQQRKISEHGKHNLQRLYLTPRLEHRRLYFYPHTMRMVGT